MGGNALVVNTSVRLTKKNFDRMAADCVARLRARFPGKRIVALGSYRAKMDFGDLDILVEGGKDYDPHQAAAALDAVEVVRNGPVTSVGVVVRPEVPHRDGNVFQVDLIKMEAEGFDFACRYFGAGDAGNLIGRIAHALGTSLHHDGLLYIFRDGDYRFREIVLTRNFSETLTFLGYDPSGFEAGFESAEDIYRYVVTTPFFSPSIYLLENRNAKSRVRDKKRVMYTNFLRFCENTPDLPAFEFPADKDVWLPRIAEFFPHFQAEYDQAVADLADQRATKEKFNGKWVADLTGLEGKDLGVLMKRFKESFGSEVELRRAVLQSSEAELKAKVLALFDDFERERLFAG